MRQTSPSQASGGSPFCARARFVCSNARFSMSFGTTVAAGAEARVTGAIEVIRRATGCDLASWPRANWQQARMRAESGSRRDIDKIQPRPEYQNRQTSINKVLLDEFEAIVGAALRGRPNSSHHALFEQLGRPRSAAPTVCCEIFRLLP